MNSLPRTALASRRVFRSGDTLAGGLQMDVVSSKHEACTSSQASSRFELPKLHVPVQRRPRPSSLNDGALLLQGRSGSIKLVEDVQDGTELGTTSTQGHPLKRVWDAALLLYGMGLLQFQVDAIAEESSICHYILAVRVSGSLTLPHLGTAALPDYSRAAYLAAGVLMQYIAGLQPEASSASADTHIQEPDNGDAGSSGPQNGAQDLAGLDLDVRERIYDMVRPLDWMEEAPEPPGLACTMRGYQRRALAWMAAREASAAAADQEGRSSRPSSSKSAAAGSPTIWNGSPHPAWQRLVFPSGLPLYHNWMTGAMQWQPPAAPQRLRGGVLADEMGLGKTVVCLALILRDAAACRGAPGRGGTLVAATPALMGQWEAEAGRHAPGLKVVVYDGMSRKTPKDDDQEKKKRRSKKSFKKMSREERFKTSAEAWEAQAAIVGRNASATAERPADEQAAAGPEDDTSLAQHAYQAQLERLLAADVVLVPYGILSQEVHQARGARGAGHTLRHAKRYLIADSPLTAIPWWRLMLDEAQNVGDGFSQVGDMAAMVGARSRWVVTGTPIGSGGLADLHGLLRVLQHDPFQDRQLWRACIARPYAEDKPWALERMEAVLQPIMWRNDKISVGDELKLPPRTLDKVPVHFGEGERLFYGQVQDAAVPIRQALAEHSEADSSQAAQPAHDDAPPSPRSMSAWQQRRQANAARKAEEAAGTAVLQLRRCCDHPQLTSFWRQMGQEMQLQGAGRAGVLTIAEANTRLADFAQNKLQAMERELCTLLNTLAVSLLNTASGFAEKKETRAASKGKGKKRDADTEEAKETPRKRRKGEDGAAEPQDPRELRAEALQLLRKSHAVSQHGIQGTWGEEASFILPANAIRAWRPIEVNVYELLADLLESSEVDCLDNEDPVRMRASAQAKLADITEVQTTAAEAKSAAVTQLHHHVDVCRLKSVQQCEAALRAGWADGLPGEAEPHQWTDGLLQRYRECKAEDSLASSAQEQVRRAAVTEMLRPAEEALIERRALLECICMPPILQSHAEGIDAVLSVLTGSVQHLSRAPGQPHPAALQQVLEHMLMEMACQPARRREALLAAAHIRECDPGTTWLALSLMRRMRSDLRRELHRLSERQTKASRVLAQNGLLAATAALEAVCAQLDFLRSLRELYSAELAAHVASYNLEQANKEARGAAQAVSSNPKDLSLAALRKDINERERKCKDMLHQHRFIRQTVTSESAVLAESEGPVLRERAVQNVAPAPGSWQAGTQAQTWLAACLAGFSLTAQQASSGSAPLLLQVDQQHGTSSEATEAPASAAALPAQQILAHSAAADSAAEVRRRRQSFLDSLQQGGQPQGNSNSRSASELRLNGSAAVDNQEPEEAKVDGMVAAVSNSECLQPGDQLPNGAVPESMQAGAPGTADGRVSLRQRQPAEQSGSKQADQQAHQECEICLTPMRFAYLLPCGHSMCENCYGNTYPRGTKRLHCIFCRKPFAASAAFRCPVAVSQQPRRDDPKYAMVSVQGDYGAKVVALLRRLIWLKENEPEIKSLVFSQWKDALLVVSKALSAHSIGHVSLTGGRQGKGPRKVIKQFQEDPETKVFLLTRGQGAAGLTLTQASYVFLLEPSLNVAVEQQALARVHRFGQTRPVRIVRFICHDTVEEEVAREAESKQALLTEAAQNTGNEAQRQEDISGGQLRRLLDAALRHRLAEQPATRSMTQLVHLDD